MAFELKEGQGTLWDNRDRKRKFQNPHMPDYSGTIKINGKIMEIAAWQKEGTKGDFYSVQISEKREKGATAGLPKAEQPATPPQQPPAQGDIPF